MQFNVLIIAAGLGTRMKSRRAKVLHQVAGKPMIAYGVRAALGLSPGHLLVVVGHQAEAVRAAVEDEIARGQTDTGRAPQAQFVSQAEQLGTGHAVQVAREALLKIKGSLVIYYGDAPLIRSGTIEKLARMRQEGHHAASLVTVWADDPTGYGRIIRSEAGDLLGIIEHRDATPEQRQIKEVNPGLYCFEIEPLVSALDQLEPRNVQGEYYLPDVFGILQRQGLSIGVFEHDEPEEFLGVNNRVELARVSATVRRRVLDELMLNGVTIIDPDSTYISPDAVIGPDTIIHPQVIIEGQTRIGADCELHSWTRIVNSRLGDRVTVRNSCVIVGSRLGDDTSVGPFAHLRMEADLGDEAVVGNFVEVKKSRLGRKTKAMHLAYLGDATIGERVNVGAGTITCNYDGQRKHPTFIEDDVKLGSDTMLVAPVRVGRGARTGAGAVVTEDVPEKSLVVGVPAKVKKTLD